MGRAINLTMTRGNRHTFLYLTPICPPSTGQTLQSVLDGFQVTGEDGTRAFPAAAPGDRVIDVAQAAGLFHTASEARRAIKSGGVYLNNMRVEDGDAVLTDADFLQGRFALIRRGKKALGAVEHR